MLKPSILAGVPHEIVQLNGRRPLREPEAPDANTFVVVEGLLGLYVMDNRGVRQFVGLKFPGEIILAGSRTGIGVWPMIASTVAVLTADPPLHAADCIAAAQRDLRIAQEWIARSRGGCAERIAHLLCEIAVRSGTGPERMKNVLTQAQLGDITGQTSVNVNRVIRSLEEWAFERHKGREIVFTDWEGLAKLGGFNPAYLEA